VQLTPDNIVSLLKAMTPEQRQQVAAACSKLMGNTQPSGGAQMSGLAKRMTDLEAAISGMQQQRDAANSVEGRAFAATYDPSIRSMAARLGPQSEVARAIRFNERKQAAAPTKTFSDSPRPSSLLDPFIRQALSKTLAGQSILRAHGMSPTT
jgi:hypothetical protein